jgi:hypothetical protein
MMTDSLTNRRSAENIAEEGAKTKFTYIKMTTTVPMNLPRY